MVPECGRSTVSADTERDGARRTDGGGGGCTPDHPLVQWRAATTVIAPLVLKDISCKEIERAAKENSRHDVIYIRTHI